MNGGEPVGWVVDCWLYWLLGYEKVIICARFSLVRKKNTKPEIPFQNNVRPIAVSVNESVYGLRT